MGHITNRLAADWLAEQRKKGNMWLKLLFAAYALLLIWVVLLKTEFNFSVLIRDHGTLNLIPFHSGSAGGAVSKFDIVANILVFIPLGVYLMMFGLSYKRTVIFGGVLSLCFEVLQFLFAIGVSDITDLITNTLGTVLGVLAYILLCRLLKDREKTERIIKIVATLFTSLALAVFLWVFVRELMKI